MPWVFPSHQAPALSLKIWKPFWFSGLALCLGSMSPDLEFILRLDDDWIVSHTLAAQLYFTGPLVVLLYALGVGLVLPWLLPLLPAGPPFHPEELAALRLPRSPRGWLVVAASGSLGGLTHILLDGVTHANHSGFLLPLLPFLRVPVLHLGGQAPLFEALQFWLTVILGLAAWGSWLRIAREGLLWRWRGGNRQPIRSAPVSDRARAAAWLAAWVLVGATTACGIRPIRGMGHGVELAAYGAITFLGLGLVASALADRIRLAARLRSHEGLPAEAAVGGSGSGSA